MFYLIQYGSLTSSTEMKHFLGSHLSYLNQLAIIKLNNLNQKPITDLIM